jgi:putative nucleotidyltransferase with HDIG domain
VRDDPVTGSAERVPLGGDLAGLDAASQASNGIEVAFGQAQSLADELQTLHQEQRATRAELEGKIREVEHYQQQLLAYARDLADVYRRLEGTYLATLEALARAVEGRDYETGGHSQRVVRCALTLGDVLGMHSGELKTLRYGALLHDVGKIGIPDAVLLKPNALTANEWQIMRRHPEIGFEMLRNIDFLVAALPIVRHHHERFDGGGYPDGLAGEAIPLGARIFAIADSLDAMTADRPYRRGLSPDAAIDEVKGQSGSQFDPVVVDAFLTVVPRLY